ncbi:conserved hypothetical protein [Aliiroseovarius halocynthiae]|uniref:DUF4139 domain-containing protein n=1 Tax=Aliiroseovarius halocynthiae TaxID=985055 RepID=A0A545SZK6_9RHOB|nr:mucoidy inhibitor MuiA family protein [Aliiroseovarius halocynthiae]TQV70406.1 DUF4139 domain-containing protein [Aliiroseovarius halocynthiae]SMR81877.1 conserved hypothetical protein [Aliiroseovarius halocynthiae]
MRFTLPLLLLTAGPVFADTFHTAPRAVSATLYANVAEVTHQIALSLPAGTHEVLFPFEFGRYNQEPRLTTLTEGVNIVHAKRLLGGLEHPEQHLTPEQQAALESVETAQEAVQAHADKISEIKADMQAVATRLDFLSSVTAGDLDMTPSDIANVSNTLQREVASARDAYGKLNVILRTATEEQTDLSRALEAAETKLHRLLPPEERQDLWALQVSASQPTEAIFQMKELQGDASWSPTYDIHVSSDAMDRIELVRKVKIQSSSGISWRGVDVTLSTNAPTGQISPRDVDGSIASVVEDILVMQKAGARHEDQMSFGSSVMEAPAVEEEIIIPSFHDAVNKGGGVVYTYGTPIDLGPDDELHLEMDRIALSGDTQIHASPREDATAFWVSKIQNTIGEPILEGDANIYRDGVLVGTTYVGEVVEGDLLDLPLGPVKHIRLTYAEKDDQVGARGFIKSATSRTHQALVRVENLSGEAEDVRVFFPTTYSEQEELNVTVTATPQPSEMDFEDQRGVTVWDLNVPAKGQSEISIKTTLRWPEGKSLSWAP